jgi:hypothetical protein
MANSNAASVGTEPAGTTASGRKIAAMEKPLATGARISLPPIEGSEAGS